MSGTVGGRRGTQQATPLTVSGIPDRSQPASYVPPLPYLPVLAQVLLSVILTVFLTLTSAERSRWRHLLVLAECHSFRFSHKFGSWQVIGGGKHGSLYLQPALYGPYSCRVFSRGFGVTPYKV